LDLNIGGVFIIHFDFFLNFPSLITAVIAWIIIGILSFRIYKKQDAKPKIWIIPIILLVGLFSFSFNMELFHTMVKLSILPLGVWILYFFFRKKNEIWQTYRRFAWLGFFANFIFLASTLAAVPIQNAMYPESELGTYLNKIENPKVTTLHPSASDVILNKSVLKKQLSSMTRENVDMIGWYNDIVNMDIERDERVEKFPYQLIGTSPKWGSNLHTLVFIEKDGKGLLITTPQNQYYYRSDQTFVVKGEER
jgi:hypothetical protein